jgi:hypothetical protein
VRFLTVLVIFSLACFSQELPSDLEWIWIKIQNGTYKIDIENDDGDVYMPVITDQNKTIYILRDYSKMLEISNFNLVKQIPFSMCSVVSDISYPELLTATKACESLKKDPSTYKENILKICLKDIKRQISYDNDPLTQEKTIQNLYKLPRYQQDFAAAVFTGYGEGRSEVDKEVALIFKTISNRIRYAKEKGCTNANALDVVLQRKQFSMWNKNDPNWSKAVSEDQESYSEDKQQQRMIKIFIKFKNNNYRFDPKKDLEKVYHYRTKNISTIPEWGATSKARAVVKVNGTNLGASNSKVKNAHYFFKSVAWSFKYPYLREKKKGEDACYSK